MLKTLNVLFIALFLIQGVIAGKAFSEGILGVSQQGVVKTVPQQEAEMPAELKKSIMRKEEKGLDLARSAIEMADPYPNLKESVKVKAEEIQELTRKKTALQTMIQRTKVDMNKKDSRVCQQSPYVGGYKEALYEEDNRDAAGIC